MTPRRKLIVYGIAYPMMLLASVGGLQLFVLVQFEGQIVTRMVEEVQPDQGPDLSTDIVKAFRAEIRSAAAAVTEGFTGGRADEALARIASADERILSFPGSGDHALRIYLDRVAAVAQQDLDRAVADALDAKRVPAGALARLDALYADSLAHEAPLAHTIPVYLDMMEKCVRTFDRKQGLLRWFQFEFPPDGIAQVAAIKADWTAHRSMRCPAWPHFIVGAMFQNAGRAETELTKSLSLRKSVRVRLRHS